MSLRHTSSPQSVPTGTEPALLALLVALPLAFADVGLSQSASRVFALESAPFLVVATTALLLVPAFLAQLGLRGLRSIGTGWAAGRETIVIATTVVVAYELLRWRLSGGLPLLPAIGVGLLVGGALALLSRSRGGLLALGVAVVALSGAWTALSALDPGGNPTARALFSTRPVAAITLQAAGLQAIWLLIVAMLWRWKLSRPPRALAASGAFLALVAVGGAGWLAAASVLDRAPPPTGSAGMRAATAGPGLPHVVLVVLDTVRADRTDLARAGAGTTPALAALGARGAIFDRAYANNTWSLPSHASLFTGLFSHHHGALGRILGTRPRADGGEPELVIDSVPLAGEFITLAEHLSDLGYDTAALAANHGYFSEVFGLLQGFGHVDVRAKNVLALETIVSPFMRRAPGPLEATYRWATRSIVDSHEWTTASLAWLDSREDPERPFFLFMNWADAHEPLSIAGSPRIETLPRRDPEAFQAYDEALLHQDRALDRLLAGLTARGLTENTLVIVTSDHGETIAEDYPAHGGEVRQDQIWVPLVVAGPGGPRGRFTHPVTLADIPVWLLDRLAGSVPEGLDGTPLEQPGDRLVESYFARAVRGGGVTFSNVDELRPTTWATFDGPWKLVRTAGGDDRLMNLEAPAQADAESLDPELLARMGARLDRLLPENIDAWRFSITSRDEVDPATMERLRSLGYIQ